MNGFQAIDGNARTLTENHETALRLHRPPEHRRPTDSILPHLYSSHLPAQHPAGHLSDHPDIICPLTSTSGSARRCREFHGTENVRDVCAGDEEDESCVIAMEEADSSINGFVNDAVSSAERDFGKGIIKVDVSTVEVDRVYEDESYDTACAVLYRGVSLILDMTWTGWNRIREIAADSAVAYVRGDAVLTPFVQAMDDLLVAKNATDAALIFETEKELNQTLYYLIGYSIIRVVVLDELNEASTMKVRAMRPSPTYYVIYATSANMETLFKAAIDGGLVRRDGTWNLVFTDYNYQDFRYIAGDLELNVSINILTMKNEVCCRLIGESPCTCPNDFQASGKSLTETETYLSASIGVPACNIYPSHRSLIFFVETVHCTYAKERKKERKKKRKKERKKKKEIWRENKRTALLSTFPRYFKRLIGLLISVMSEVQKSGVTVEPKVINCKNKEDVLTDNTTVEAFKKNLLTKLSTNHTFEYLPDRNLITYRAEIELKTLTQGRLQKVGEWNRQHKITTDKGMEITPARRFFRIGTAQMIPWSYVKKNVETQQPVLDDEGKEVWEGYCIDLMKKLAETMDFDYELVIPSSGGFGERLPNGKWTGIVGDLLRGEIDIAVAPLTMTSEREEVIDFVAPYYEQSGILIAIRKPVRKTSLFKFMTVLRLEVWLSIVGALTVTGIMIWLLDKYSPYSARNNKNLYPYPCREFTLKESFWFALTSFTPQGGGEAPKALSGRTLVAAYWLFVVLMLATFTANLAAFLTVERMQSPVQSLEQLARQSRINYTVLANSHVHQYFINMKNAEDKLYTVWKEITLNSTSEQVEYRVWDYPIKEQYGHILQAITQAGPVESARAGFQKVIDSENAEFAFIHDSGEIKYEVTKNCNLTEVGEVFAEQPYAIAVQQGSHLQEEISKRILDLQKDRYFETLSSKYWNQSLRESCPNSDDSEGITLESLGGVFIATLFGLALAMITLAGEVIFYRKRKVSRKEQPPAVIKSRKIPTLQMKPAPVVSLVDRPMKNIQPRVSHISVYPRHFAFKEYGSANKFTIEVKIITRVSQTTNHSPSVKMGLLRKQMLVFLAGLMSLANANYHYERYNVFNFDGAEEPNRKPWFFEDYSSPYKRQEGGGGFHEPTKKASKEAYEDPVEAYFTASTNEAPDKKNLDFKKAVSAFYTLTDADPEIYKSIIMKSGAPYCQETKNKVPNNKVTKKRYRRDAMTCYKCKDPKNGATYEQCSYTSEPQASFTVNRYQSPPSQLRYRRSNARKEKTEVVGGKKSGEKVPEYRFAEEYFVPASSEEVPTEYKKKSEHCSKVVKDSMVCMVCKDPETNGKYEQCSYTNQPDDKAYAYSKSSSFGRPHDEEKQADESRVPSKSTKRTHQPKVESSYDGSHPEMDKYIEEQSAAIRERVPKRRSDALVSEESEKLESGSEDMTDGSCKKIVKGSMVCTVCKDPKTSGSYEQCAYANHPSDKVYQFSRQKSFGYPGGQEQKSSPQKASNTETPASYSSDTAGYSGGDYTGYQGPSADYYQPSAQQKSEHREYQGGEEPEKYYEKKQSYDYVPEYKVAGDGPSVEHVKSESEKIAEEIKGSDGCRKVEKDSMTCTVCNDPKTGGDFEQCSYTYQPNDKVFSFSSAKSFGSPDPAEKKSQDYGSSGSSSYGDDRGSYGDASDNKPHVTSGETQSKEVAESSGEAGVQNPVNVDVQFFSTKEKKKEIAKVLSDFQQEDRSKCKKVIRDKLTCYQCVDDDGMQKEECIFVAEQEPAKDRVAYHEVKEYQLDPAPAAASVSLPEEYRVIKSSSNGSPLAPKKRKTRKTRPVKYLYLDDAASSATENEEQQSDPRGEVFEDPIEVQENEEQKTVPYDIDEETKPVFDKALGMTLPRYMLTTSEHEAEFDKVVASG
ncbi:uncharacterized protein LOC124302692 [Neodiprion virginianus]|uniref:uncharacterized protein LOC124302692 n=1 Tax=Neodiprion virginianus TaxID=2961670 RepID=UPI001EE6C7F0|nr:uncharacterized protein LOC124302692 [Neodiprion virginianus]